MAGYRPMTVADLAAQLMLTGNDKTRWKLFREFLEEYRRAVIITKTRVATA